MVDISTIAGCSNRANSLATVGGMRMADAAAGIYSSKVMNAAKRGDHLREAMGDLSGIGAATKEALALRGSVGSDAAAEELRRISASLGHGFGSSFHGLGLPSTGVSVSRASSEFEKALGSIETALGGRVSDYYKSRDRMRDEQTFGASGLSAADAGAEEIRRITAPLGQQLGDGLDQLGLASTGFSNSRAQRELEKAQESVRAALGGSVSDYVKSRDHMRDIFGFNSFDDETSRLISSPYTAKEVQHHLAEFEEALHHEPVMREFPCQPFVPPNPMIETNEHLAQANEKIDALVHLQARQAEVIGRLLEAQIANEAAQDRLAKQNLRLNLLSLVLTNILALAAIAVSLAVAGWIFT